MFSEHTRGTELFIIRSAIQKMLPPDFFICGIGCWLFCSCADLDPCVEKTKFTFSSKLIRLPKMMRFSSRILNIISVLFSMYIWTSPIILGGQTAVQLAHSAGECLWECGQVRARHSRIFPSDSFSSGQWFSFLSGFLDHSGTLVLSTIYQCCESMKFFYGSGCGSGSADPYISLMDTDPDPAIFVSDFQEVNKKKFFCFLLFEGTFTSFFRDKKP